MEKTTENNIYTLQSLDALIKALTSKGYTVIGPKRDGDLVLFRELQSVAELYLGHVSANDSIKDVFFPRSEKVLSFNFDGRDIEIDDPPDVPGKTVIIGAKPCDAASLPIMDKLFQQDCCDPFWEKRRSMTTVISVACTKCDEYCFCTSVGLSPESTDGADIMLTPAGDDNAIAETLTEKGMAIVTDLADIFNKGDGGAHGKDAVSAVPVKFDNDKVKRWLDSNFEDTLWEEFSRQCIGCGVCTFSCPTCHCFDIIDEGTLNGGDRLKNWDACQMKMFTMHTSGHNPRSSQDQRWRQRIMHKFRYYVDKFDATLCVGCGRCSRRCPVDMNIAECLSTISEKGHE